VIVIDASSVVSLFRDDEGPGFEVRRLLAEAAQGAHAPHLLDLEVANALRRLVRRDEVTPERAAEGLRDAGLLAVERWSHGPLLERVWSLRDRLTAYDAAYLALAEALGATLVTLDAGLATVASRTVSVADLD
jgi:predicted nucleic acid-binding protein